MAGNGRWTPLDQQNLQMQNQPTGTYGTMAGLKRLMAPPAAPLTAPGIKQSAPASTQGPSTQQLPMPAQQPQRPQAPVQQQGNVTPFSGAAWAPYRGGPPANTNPQGVDAAHSRGAAQSGPYYGQGSTWYSRQNVPQQPQDLRQYQPRTFGNLANPATGQLDVNQQTFRAYGSPANQIHQQGQGNIEQPYDWAANYHKRLSTPYTPQQNDPTAPQQVGANGQQENVPTAGNTNTPQAQGTYQLPQDWTEGPRNEDGTVGLSGDPSTITPELADQIGREFASGQFQNFTGTYQKNGHWYVDTTDQRGNKVTTDITNTGIKRAARTFSQGLGNELASRGIPTSIPSNVTPNAGAQARAANTGDTATAPAGLGTTAAEASAPGANPFDFNIAPPPQLDPSLINANDQAIQAQYAKERGAMLQAAVEGGARSGADSSYTQGVAGDIGSKLAVASIAQRTQMKVQLQLQNYEAQLNHYDKEFQRLMAVANDKSNKEAADKAFANALVTLQKQGEIEKEIAAIHNQYSNNAAAQQHAWDNAVTGKDVLGAGAGVAAAAAPAVIDAVKGSSNSGSKGGGTYTPYNPSSGLGGPSWYGGGNSY